MSYEYISADNHLDKLWIPADLWQTRLAGGPRAAGAQVVVTPDGTLWGWGGGARGAAGGGGDNGRLLGAIG